MITRVTENMKFNTITNNLFNAQGKSAALMEQLSSEKMINRPSDNPIGANNVLNYRSAMASIDQYQTNISNAKTWLSLTDTNLSGIKDIVSQARDISVSQSSAVASNETMDANASVLSSLIDDAISLLNTKQGDSYLFGGSKTDVAPFSAAPIGSIGDVAAAPVNNFDGAVTSAGTYTGTVNKTYAVKIIDGGTAQNLSDAQYQVSDDGGATWGATQTDLSAQITLGEGIKMTFTPSAGAHTLAVDDSFSVNATTASIGNATEALQGGLLAFNGTVTSGATYTGTVNKTYALQIINGGTLPDLSDAQYKVSEDGGAHWGSTQTGLSNPINVGDGVIMTFAPGTNPPVVGDQFTVNATAANVGAANSALDPASSFDGTVISGGPYTGTVNKAYAVKIIGAGVPAAATYKISTDGGATWSAATYNDLSNPINFGDGLGVTMTFTPGINPLHANDTFTVNATAANVGAATSTLQPGSTFNGTVASGAAYTGTVNKAYAVKIIGGGAPAAATYKISTDGGATWSAATYSDLSNPVNFGDGLGVTMSFTPGVNPLHANDLFTVNAGAAITEDATEAPVNTFDGTVTSSGTYTGIENKTYTLKIIAGGHLADATYKISDDGGATWGATQTGLSALAGVTVGDGIKMTFTAGNHDLVADDSFTVEATATSFDAASAATDNDFNGAVTAGGTYTGTENKAYAVKIIDGGTLDAATYKISEDGGKTWAAEQSFPPKEVKGQVANKAWSSPITAATKWNEIDGANVQDGTSFTITGTKRDGTDNGTAVAGTYTITNAESGTVQDLLDQINTIFGKTAGTAGTAIASIDEDGKITLTDTTPGATPMEMTLVTNTLSGGHLDFGAVNATTTKTITLGDGMDMTFTPSTVDLAANDLFTVNAYAAGYYRGNNDNLTVQIGKGNNLVYNISGSSAFTAANGPVAAASVTTGTGTTLTKDDTIMLTRGATAGSWTLTNHSNYPNMAIKTVSADKVTIDADGHGTDIITLALSGEWNASDTASFSIAAGEIDPVTHLRDPGSVSPFTAVHGPGTVDLLTILNALKSGLDTHDVAAISAQTDNLNNIQTQVLEKQTEVGSKTNSLDLASSNLKALNDQITSMKSTIEDIDQAKIITSFQMQQIALQASYNLAAQIGKMTILDYLT